MNFYYIRQRRMTTLLRSVRSYFGDNGGMALIYGFWLSVWDAIRQVNQRIKRLIV